MNRGQRRNLHHLMHRAMSGVSVGFTPVASGKVWGGAPPEIGGQTDARRRLARWVKSAYPELYAATMRRAEHAAKNGTLGQADSGGNERSLLDRFTSTLEKLAPTYLQYKTQKDILDVQLERARQDLPPLETGQYAPTMQIGLDPETVERLANEATERAGAGASALVRSPMLWLAGGVAGFALFRALSRNGGRRRRR